jgi:hypothetical protein
VHVDLLMQLVVKKDILHVKLTDMSEVENGLLYNGMNVLLHGGYII